MTESELRRRFPVGTRVRQREYGVAVFVVDGYWRGNLRLRTPKFGTTHHAPPRHVRRVAT